MIQQAYAIRIQMHHQTYAKNISLQVHQQTYDIRIQVHHQTYAKSISLQVHQQTYDISIKEHHQTYAISISLILHLSWRWQFSMHLLNHGSWFICRKIRCKAPGTCKLLKVRNLSASLLLAKLKMLNFISLIFTSMWRPWAFSYDTVLLV